MPTKPNALMLLISLTALACISCAKIPEKPVSPAVNIKLKTQSASESMCMINFTCGLKNENDSTVFTDVKGTVEITGERGTVLAVPFEIPEILPFETGIVQKRLEKKLSDVKELTALLNITENELKPGSGSRFIDEKNIKLRGLELKKTDIIKLLRSRIDEKNK